MLCQLCGKIVDDVLSVFCTLRPMLFFLHYSSANMPICLYHHTADSGICLLAAIVYYAAYISIEIGRRLIGVQHTV